MAAKFYVFDAYGTLFDVHAAVRQHAESVGPDAARVSELWRGKQLEYTWTLTLMGRYRDFWNLTEEALDFAMASVPSANGKARQALLDAYWTLQAFEEVPTVLADLKQAGAKTGILSNGSSKMLDAAVQSAGIARHLDAVLSVDAIQIFKPRAEVYKLVLDHFACEPQDVAFQSSNRWDIAGAAHFGFQTNWINRGGAPEEYAGLIADRIVSDLNALIE